MKDKLFIISLIGFGGIALTTQSILIREFLAIFFGNELTIGILFSIWFTGIMIGAWLASFIMKKHEEALVDFYPLLLLCMALIAIGDMIFIRLSRWVFHVGIGQQVIFEKMLLMSICTIIPFSALIGFVFPVACQIWIKRNGSIRTAMYYEMHSAKKISKVYIIESFGSMAAGALLSYLLLSKVRNFKIMMVWSMLIAFISAALYLISGNKETRIPRIRSAICGAVACILAAIYIAGIDVKVDDMTVLIRWKGTVGNVELIKSVDTKYQNLALGRSGNIYLLYSNGHYAGSFPDVYAGAMEAHLIMGQKPDAGNMLILGFGAENAISEILKYPFVKIDYVMLDPEYLNLVQYYFPEQLSKIYKDPRISVILQDGRFFVNRCTKKYDIVIVKQPDPTNANINRFYTVQFYARLKDLMNENGIVVAYSSSAINYFSEETFDYTGSLYATLKSVFPAILATPGEKTMFIASRSFSDITLKYEVLAGRYEKAGIISPHFSKYHFQYLLEPEKVMFVNAMLENYKESRINSDEQPSAFFLNLIVWEKFSSRQFSRFLSSMKNLPMRYILAFPVLLFIVRILLQKLLKASEIRARFDVLLSIFAVGFAGISLDLLILFYVQSMYGYVYQMISLLIALFMAGLVLGSLMGNKLIQIDRVKTYVFAIISLFLLYLEIIALSKFIDVHFLRPEWQQVAFSIFMIFSGFFTGIFFPFANIMYMKTGSSSFSSSGKTDSIDHLGAAIGSLVTGCFLIPVYGASESLYLLLLLLAIAAASLLMSKQ